MRLNIMFVLAHILLYSSVIAYLDALNNPFADLLIMLGVISLIGLWLCFDFFIPVLCMAVCMKNKALAKPIAGMMFLSLCAFLSGSYQVISYI